MDADNAWARALTDEVMADHLKAIAADIRKFTPRKRAALLDEAAHRLLSQKDPQ
jgi:hypothetical protein